MSIEHWVCFILRTAAWLQMSLEHGWPTCNIFAIGALIQDLHRACCCSLMGSILFLLIVHGWFGTWCFVASVRRRDPICKHGSLLSVASTSHKILLDLRHQFFSSLNTNAIAVIRLCIAFCNFRIHGILSRTIFDGNCHRVSTFFDIRMLTLPWRTGHTVKMGVLFGDFAYFFSNEFRTDRFAFSVGAAPVVLIPCTFFMWWRNELLLAYGLEQRSHVTDVFLAVVLTFGGTSIDSSIFTSPELLSSSMTSIFVSTSSKFETISIDDPSFAIFVALISNTTSSIGFGWAVRLCFANKNSFVYVRLHESQAYFCLLCDGRFLTLEWTKNIS